MSRCAVVLFNLGGPDDLDAVRPFLGNLFRDPAILRVPAPVRWVLAWAIARRRAPMARETYRAVGGASPLRAQTEAQASALEAALGGGTRVFVCMRYWAPRAPETAAAVARFAPDEIVLLPLYPQFSSSTTASSLRDWRRVAARLRGIPTRTICCWPEERGFVAAVADAVAAQLEGWAGPPPRILYSAHGIPKSYIAAGDPYQLQVERSVAAVRTRLARGDLEQLLCYQSRVGPMAWTEPYTDAEIARAGTDGCPVIVTPIAFVSEHVETLVELDRDYRALAERHGVPRYERSPTVGTAPRFIAGLARLVAEARAAPPGGIRPGGGGGICPAACRDCPAAA